MTKVKMMNTMFKNKNILIGVSGGIAIYKTLDLISKLKKLGANVKVIMTDSATKFVKPITFQTMSENIVHTEMFNQLSNMDVEHISLAKWADLFLVAPATANVIAKFAAGIADDMLTTVMLAKTSEVLIAPAMNTKMLENPATQINIETLIQRGFNIMCTGSGRLACGDVGEGKMAEPDEIIKEIEFLFTEKDLVGKKVLITSGPTMEPLDPVRYITNHSSGKMGYAIARNAHNRGAEVTLISGPTNLEPPKVNKFIPVRTTLEMFEAVGEYFEDTDLLVKSAAPSDFKPKSYSEHKIKKSGKTEGLTIELEPNPDIAKFYGAKKSKQIIVGFAAESRDVEKQATEKLKAKNFDIIVGNNITQEGAGFKSDTNIVSIIDKNGNIERNDLMTKDELAIKILDRAKTLMNEKS